MKFHFLLASGLLLMAKASGKPDLRDLKAQGRHLNEKKNKEIVQSAWLDFAAGNVEGFLDLLHENVAWTVIGSDTYTGKDDIFFNVLLPLLTAIQTNEPQAPPVAGIRQLTAEEERVVMETTFSFVRACDEFVYDQAFAFSARVDDKLIKNVIEYSDTELDANFFATPPIPCNR